LELDPRTFQRVRALPLAEELVVHGRQEMVKRLDSYELEHTELLSQIVELVSTKFMPIITRHALSGRAHVNSEDPIFNEPLAIPMLIDLYQQGRLDLDRFVSETISIDDVEEAFHKMERGEVLRSVVVM